MIGEYIILTHRFLGEDGRVAAFCDELGLVTFGDNKDEADAQLEEAITQALNFMAGRGEIRDYLKKHEVRIYVEVGNED